jgi:hypothetical protein
MKKKRGRTKLKQIIAKLLSRGKNMKRRERKIEKNEEKTGQDKVKANNCHRNKGNKVDMRSNILAYRGRGENCHFGGGRGI